MKRGGDDQRDRQSDDDPDWQMTQQHAVSPSQARAVLPLVTQACQLGRQDTGVGIGFCDFLV